MLRNLVLRLFFEQPESSGMITAQNAAAPSAVNHRAYDPLFEDAPPAEAPVMPDVVATAPAPVKPSAPPPPATFTLEGSTPDTELPVSSPSPVVVDEIAAIKARNQAAAAAAAADMTEIPLRETTNSERVVFLLADQALTLENNAKLLFGFVFVAGIMHIYKLMQVI